MFGTFNYILDVRISLVSSLVESDFVPLPLSHPPNIFSRYKTTNCGSWFQLGVTLWQKWSVQHVMLSCVCVPHRASVLCRNQERWDGWHL